MKKQVSWEGLGVKKKVESILGKTSDVCKKCPLRNSHYVKPEIRKDAEILIIGEAPGEEEVKQGRPFIGRSGQLLRKVLDRLGVKYSITNVVCCRPLDENGKNRAPKKKEITCCSEKLQSVVQGYNRIVLLGSTALEAFFPGLKISDVVGDILYKNEKKFLVGWHPAYIVRNPNLFEIWEEDFLRVKDGLLTDIEPFDYVIIDDKGKFEEVKRRLKKEQTLFIDIETDSLDKLEARVLVLGIAGEQTLVYCLLVEEDWISELNEVIEGKSIVMHNAIFDFSILKRFGIKFYNCRLYDTQIMAYILDERKRTYQLKTLVRDLIGYKYYFLIDRSNILDYNLEEISRYNSEDVGSMRMLYDYLRGELTKKQIKLLDDIISPALKVVSEICMNGMKLDLDLIAELQKKYKQLIEEKEVFLKQYADIDWNSTKQVSDFLLAKNVDGKRTKTGRIALQKGDVDELFENIRNSELRTILNEYREYKRLTATKSTFLDGMLKKVGKYGRVRSNFHFVRTETGRLSSSQPNLQNIPRDSEIRSLFIPEEGYKFVEADLSQIELRVAAVVSGDKTMREAYKEGKDLHCLTAAFISGKDIEEVTPEDRQRAKAVNFSLIYLASWRNLKRQAKSSYGVIMSDEEAMTAHAKFFELYPGIKEYHREVEKFVLKHGYIESKFGRRRRFYEELKSGDDAILDSVIRRAVNFPIQSVASDLNLMIMGRLYKYCKELFDEDDVRFVTTVHDQFMLEVRESIVDDVVHLIEKVTKEVEKSIEWWDIPLVEEVKVKDRW